MQEDNEPGDQAPQVLDGLEFRTNILALSAAIAEADAGTQPAAPLPVSNQEQDRAL